MVAKLSDNALVAVEGTAAGIAGALVYWSLSGSVDITDLGEALQNNGLDPEEWLPNPPTKEEVMRRAAQDSLDGGRRQMVRPLKKRGDIAVVTESVIKDPATGRERLSYANNVLVHIERHDDGSRSVKINPVGDVNVPLAQKIAANARKFEGLFVSTDISNWLIRKIEVVVHGVGIRENGGIYFVPKDRLELWHRLKRSIIEASSHNLHEIPAMKSDETVEAVLTAVRSEAHATMAELETYLAGEVSTRGLNAWDEKIIAVQAKVKHYADLLGVALPDLAEKSEVLVGALQASRAIYEAKKEEERTGGGS